VEVEAFNMMMEIVKIVVVPVGAALLHDYLKFASARGRLVVYSGSITGAVWLTFLALGGWTLLKAQVVPEVLPWLGIVGFFAGAAIVGVAYHHATKRMPRLEKVTPVLSIAGIIYFTAVTTAAGRDSLLQIGGLLFLAAAIHNGVGYVLGYWLSRAGGLDKNSARTVAFEVGLQNGGMASGIAGALGKLGTMGLAAAIFSPWMNITGSILANHWKKRPVPGI
jgi:BASS family bile acid:Na+ symporter